MGLADVFSNLIENQTGLLLPVEITFGEIGLVAALIGITFLLAAVPSATVYQNRVSSLLRT